MVTGSVKRNQSVIKALEILSAFREHGDLRVVQIAFLTGLPKATALRLIYTLEEQGFLTKTEDGLRYHLGTRILELAGSFLQHWDVTRLALDEMRLLRDECGETVSLYVLDGAERVCAQRLESLQSIRRSVPIGARFPLHAGASAKVLLAFLPQDQGEALLASLPVPPGFNLSAFRRQLTRCREQGYATSREEREVGAAAVGAPVFYGQGRLAAALTVSGPANRLDADRMLAVVPNLKAAARRLSGLMVGGG